MDLETLKTLLKENLVLRLKREEVHNWGFNSSTRDLKLSVSLETKDGDVVLESDEVWIVEPS